jgi:hypothetical protein
VAEVTTIPAQRQVPKLNQVAEVTTIPAKKQVPKEAKGVINFYRSLV